jgi:hypothetical protein
MGKFLHTMFGEKPVIIQYKNRTVIGMAEEVSVSNPKGNSAKVLAKIDTGASISSIDFKLASKLKLGPITSTAMIKSASGSGVRPIVRAKLTIEGKDFDTDFTLADRSNLKYKVLVGQNILSQGFLIDPTKKVD